MGRETTKLARADTRRVVLHTPRDVRKLIRDHGLFLGGGFIRSTIQCETPNDIDLFGPDKEQLHKHAMQLALSRKGRLHETDNAYTVLSPGRTPVQFIHRWLYAKPEKLIEEFDFTIARAAVWWENNVWWSMCDSDYYADLAAKRLVYCKPDRDEDAGGSIMRARKFLKAGYFISAENLGRLISRLYSSIDFEACDRQGNTEEVIIGLLREVDPLMVVDGIDLTDEHESVQIEAPNG
jgi:hypothetical protein